MTASETAVIIPVDAVELTVAEQRRQLDVAASWGVPAHVLVLYPFVDPDAIDDGVISRLASALSSVPAFDCTFGRCDWFGQDVLWLAPEPDRPFRELTSAVWRAFPGHPPYGGVFEDVVPHLTVGERRRGSVSALQAAEATVSRQLPIRAHMDRAVLIAGSVEPDSWHRVQEFRLEPPLGEDVQPNLMSRSLADELSISPLPTNCVSLAHPHDTASLSAATDQCDTVRCCLPLAMIPSTI